MSFPASNLCVKFMSIEDAARGKSKKGYWVAVLRAGDLRNQGIKVVPVLSPMIQAMLNCRT